MLVLALDLSTKTGWAVLRRQDNQEELVDSGSFSLPNGIESLGEYPNNFISASKTIADWCEEVFHRFSPDIVVIEETNLGMSRYTQKALEFIHLSVLQRLPVDKVRYISTGEWRGNTLKLSVTTAKRLAKPFVKEYKVLEKAIKALPPKSPDKKKMEEERKRLKTSLQNKCIFGKIDRKSISVAFVNATFNKNLRKGQNDESDAICLGVAFLRGAATCNNKSVFNHKE